MHSTKRNITHTVLCVFSVATLAAVSSVAPAYGNGFGENRPFQFRSDNQRATLLNNENVRLQLEGELGVGSGGGLGAFATQSSQPTGNSVTINGNNNTISQDNAGASQSTSNGLSGGVNSAVDDSDVTTGN